MFNGINKITNTLVKSYDKNFSNDFFKSEVWYVDPLYVVSCPTDIDKSKIEVKWRYGAENVINKFMVDKLKKIPKATGPMFKGKN